MGILIFILKAYMVFLMLVLLLYIIRHYTFTLNRALGKQRLYYQDVLDEDLPTVSVLVPMHNEEKVASHILDLLVASDYPKEKLEIIPINDHSTDRTKEILEEYVQKYPFIRPLHRYGDLPRGKQNGLNDAIKIAKGEVVIVYDADYLPPKGQIRTLAIAFKDPRIGAVMGRVVPVNVGKNLLTRLLDIERSGGYLNGYKVAYANSAECYEEAPEDWNVRARQLRRWSRGHNQVMFKYFIPTIFSKKLNLWQKIDGLLLLAIYMQPFLIFLGLIDSLLLFFLGEMEITNSYLFLLFMFAHNSFGNFAPFFEIGTALMLDGTREKVFLLPLMFFAFIFNIIYTSLGFVDAVMDLITERTIIWQKTERFRNA
jgi:cellulose synthase/poly-beta-1,6-N-acetylglucosamine synthase-like glycosyltransferase